MDEKKQNQTDIALALAAEEELEQACALGWKALSRVTPWGDSYDGFAAGGIPVTFERNYIWAEGEGGDILAEVTVYRGETRYDKGARASRRIARE